MPPEPQLRPFLADPPDYGNNDTLFTVELAHNGFFCGLGNDLSYVSASHEHWDYCSTETWSLNWIDELLRQMDYERDGRLNVYWCLPDKELCDGLVCIETAADIYSMCLAARSEKTLVLMLDHTNFLKVLRADMIINARTVPRDDGDATSRADLPQGTTSRADLPQGTTSRAAMRNTEGTSGARDTFEDFVRAEDDEDSSDSDWFDSDYEAEDGDDDLYTDNVDLDVRDNNEHEDVEDVEDDTVLEDGDLHLRVETAAHLQKSFSFFNAAVDMKNPEFKVGLVFSDVKECRRALQRYSVCNRTKVNKIRNEPTRIEAVCKPGCIWWFKASKDSRKEAFTVNLYEKRHTCGNDWEVRALTASFLAETFINEFIDNRKMDLQSFAAKVQREFSMCPNRWKLGRARKEALLKIHGDEASQFSLLWDYGKELRRANPGSKFFLTTNQAKDGADDVPKHHLATLYWSYDGCKRGFLEGCRPFICVDGCHVKTKFKGVLLTAVGIDPNDCIYPIAMGLVEVECTSSWEWFLTTLRDDLNITNTSPWTIMSDKQKGLIKAVQKVFPDAEHRFCVRHLHQNYQKAGHRGEVLKNDMWAIARSTCIPKWQHNMDKLQADSLSAYAWVEELAPNTWVKAFFSDFPKCDMLLNNHCEVFNSYILEAREMPMLSMLETIFYKLMNRTLSKQKEAENMTGTICPKIRKKLDKFIEWSKNCMVISAGGGEYKVSSLGVVTAYSVDFKTRSCDCRRWQLSGIPCQHALACCRTDRIDPESLVHSCYSVETYKKAYAHNLHPLRGRAFWEKEDGVFVHPPLYTKVMGRPKKNRKKAPEELIKDGAPALSRHGLTMHCSICKKPDHNKRGHANYILRQEVDQEPTVQVQEEEVDDTTILEHITRQNRIPQLDPTHVQNSMVYRMGQEERAHAPVRRMEEPVPENAFIAAARDSMPLAGGRVTTAARGNLRGRGRTTNVVRGRGSSSGNGGRSNANGSASNGRGSANGNGRGGATRNGRGRGNATTNGRGSATGNDSGRGKKRTASTQAGPSRTAARTSTQASSGTRADYYTGPGSYYHLLFGDDGRRDGIPDLNAIPDDSEEIPISQSAP